MIAAHLAVQRADQRAIHLEESDQQRSHSVTLVRQRRRSASSSAEVALAVAGSARITSTADPGSPVSTGRCCRVRCRSRRFTRLRITALPTALLTTKPTRADCPGAWTSRCTTTVREPQRRPARTVTRKASLSMSRCAAGSTRVVAGDAAVRRPGCCDPCGGVPTGSNGQRGCACAGGNRAPCGGGGCSAGTYAYSRASLRCCFSWIVHSTGGTGAYDDHSERRTWALRPAPLTHARAPGGTWESWTCGTRRHGVTGQRYARWRIRVKLGTLPRPASLWMTACRGLHRVVRLRRTTVPGHGVSSTYPGRGWPVSGPLIGGLSCTLGVRAARRRARSVTQATTKAGGSQTVDNSVDKSPNDQMQER